MSHVYRSYQTAALQQSFICSGFEVDCLDSVKRLFMPTAAALVADLKEANDAFLIKSWPSEHPDVKTSCKTNLIWGNQALSHP